MNFRSFSHLAKILSVLVIAYLGFSISALFADEYTTIITSPTEGEIVAEGTWSPSVSWGTNDGFCEYKYNTDSYASIACNGGGSDIPPPGQTGPNTLYVRTEFEETEQLDSKSFNYGIFGCTDGNALNYSDIATYDDGSCYYNPGCTDPSASNYDNTFDFDDGSCYYNPGCTDSGASNYDGSADYDDGSCTYPVSGCTDGNAINYDASAEVDDGSCYYNPGCTDPAASNYDEAFDYDDGSCEYSPGCTDSGAINYNASASEDDGSCLYFSIESPIDGNLYNSSNWAPAITWLSNASSCDFNYNDDVWSGLDCSSGGVDLPPPDSTGQYTLNLSVDSEAYTLSSTFEFVKQGCTDDTAFNFDGDATEDDGSCYYNPGCTDSGASNYDGSADYDDGSCTYPVSGCTDGNAINYDASAEVDDGSCYYNPGCTDPAASNYDEAFDYDDGSCEYSPGCTDPTANNYNPSADSDDGSCTYDEPGCTNSQAVNYNPSANTDDGSCLYFSIQSPLVGETYNSLNWAPAITWPSNASTCEFSYNSGVNWSNLDCSSGGSDISAPNTTGTYSLDLTVDSGTYSLSSTFDFIRMTVPGCTDSEALNYSSNANQDDGSCYYEAGCTDASATNYNSNADFDDGSCEYDPMPGCTDPSATNYNPSADTDDSSCEYGNNQISGCTDASATNYNPSADTDDGSCEYDDNNNQTVPGCTDASATNYNPSANSDDGSCTFPPSGSGGGSSSPAPSTSAVVPGARTGGASFVGSSSGITGPNVNTVIRQIQSNNTTSVSPVFINLLQNRDRLLGNNTISTNRNNNSVNNGVNVVSPLAGIVGVINSDFQFTISAAPSNSITRNNQTEDDNNENLNLQRFLNSQGFIVNTNPDRPGSPGNETNVFGSLTRSALANFQRFVGIEPADGNFSPITRAFINGFLKSLEISQ